MKRILSLVLACALLLPLFGAFAEAPLFATVGESREKAEWTGYYGLDASHYVLVVLSGVRVIRVVAELDEATSEQVYALLWADMPDEDMRAQINAIVDPLPVACTEDLTDLRMEQAELDALVGKSIQELLDAGFEESSAGYGGEDDAVVFTLNRSVFEYEFTVNENTAAYEQAAEANDYSTLTVKSANYYGISHNAVDLCYKADGSHVPMEQNIEGFDEFMGILEMIMAAAESGEAVDPEELINRLVELAPEKEDEIRELVQSVFQMAE